MVEQPIVHKKKRKLFWLNALTAWTDYQATGLHSTAEEADAWLAKLEAGKEAEAPECHL
jgi:predicted transcriptional regulator